MFSAILYKNFAIAISSSDQLALLHNCTINGISEGLQIGE